MSPASAQSAPSAAHDAAPPNNAQPADLLSAAIRAGLHRGAFVALALAPSGHVALYSAEPKWEASTQPGLVNELISLLEAQLRPRWVWWSGATPAALLKSGVRLSHCWDLAAVHRLIFGGWHAEPGRIWAGLGGLDLTELPTTGQLDLLSGSGDDGGDPEDPVRPDGHLRPEWVAGGWARTARRRSAWAALAAQAAARQRQVLEAPSGTVAAGRRSATARSESAAELLCAELSHDGLPLDVERAERIIGGFVGPRPDSPQQAEQLRSRRDDAVRRHVPGVEVDLRSPAQVRAMLSRAGIDLPDTRSWRLEPFRGAHPVVDALLAWRKDERFATHYGYDWLDRQVAADGRLRGSWTGCDGGAGRMTASAGLHSMPSELREAVIAEPGHVFVRADLGQVEPRVLAAVSGDRALSAATQDDDLYAPVAARLGVERSVAKVAVLAAMYGQTSGAAGEALRGMDAAYPVAMRQLRSANEAGRDGRAVVTYGGRLVPMWGIDTRLAEPERRAQSAARGRYARNAIIQGAAAELFKAWAATVRTRCRHLGARIVLCLHDELLVQVPDQHGQAVAALLADCLTATARDWFDPPGRVRFVADVSVVHRWSEAKVLPGRQAEASEG